jgi:hypothetical protein
MPIYNVHSVRVGLPRSTGLDVSSGHFRVGNDRAAWVLYGASNRAQVSSLPEQQLGASENRQKGLAMMRSRLRTS